MKKLDVAILEALVDKHGLRHVLNALAEVCLVKAEQLHTTWGDKVFAIKWTKAAAAMSRASEASAVRVISAAQEPPLIQTKKEIKVSLYTAGDRTVVADYVVCENGALVFRNKRHDTAHLLQPYSELVALFAAGQWIGVERVARG